MKLTAKIRRMSDDVDLPHQASEDDVGYDLRASEDMRIAKGELTVVPTGLIVEPPSGYNFEVRLRSSTPRKYGLLIPHGMGVIDPKYCGPEDELGIPVYKFGDGTRDESDYTRAPDAIIKKGDRIAQLVLVKTNHFKWKDVTGTPFKGKARGGFGSTGV